MSRSTTTRWAPSCTGRAPTSAPAAQTIAEHAWRASQPVDDLLAQSQAAMLGLSDQAGVRVKSSMAGESIDRWLEGFSAERPTNDRGDRIVGSSTGLRCVDKITWG